MRHSKQFKVYVTVLAVGALALGVDQFVLSSGGPASASGQTSLLIEHDAPPGGASPRKPGDELGPAGAAQASVVTVSRRLLTMGNHSSAQTDPTPDAFSPHAKWLHIAEVAVATTKAPEPPKVELKLTSLLAGKRQTLAVINGKPVRIGQTIDGFTLISVGPRTAVLRSSAGYTQELQLVEPDNASR